MSAMKYVLAVVCFMVACVVVGEVRIKRDANGWIATTAKYCVVIGERGYISSVKVGNHEFLSQSKKIPCGSYLCAGGVDPLENLKQIGTTIISGENGIATVSYSFSEMGFEIIIENVKKKGCFYVIINNAVEKCAYTQGVDGVPTISSSPVSVVCDHTRWFLPEVSLDIVGCRKIRGPWKGHQIVVLPFAPHKKKVLEFIPGSLQMQEGAPRKQHVDVVPDVLKECFTYLPASRPVQIPLCMIGDSITWAGKGDYWRKYLLESLPHLAFVGTHSAVLGYSHAGEGGDGTHRLLGRLRNIPDCPYYSLLIGTNDNNVKEKSQIHNRAKRTAERIQKIVEVLLAKKNMKKVFLCSLLPCHTANPFRDKTNCATNVILRKKMESVFPKDKVAWVEMEIPIRAMKDWQPKIKLHPTLAGYKFISKILANAIINELGVINTNLAPVPNSGTGVRVWNLIDETTMTTIVPVVAGWYTVSFKVSRIGEVVPELRIVGIDKSLAHPLGKKLKIPQVNSSGRVVINFKTGYERCTYSRSKLKLIPVGCEISEVLFEKRRPSGKASIYSKGNYLDTKTTPALGELFEQVGKVK